MQYQITAFDGDDEEAPARRLAARPAHLEEAGLLKKEGKIIAGGAILDDDGNMVGSTLYVEFDTQEELDDWLSNDPYVKGDVWKEVNVMPIRLAVKP
ncbi:MAG: YciI family protein [Pseudohongiellaceae bacterium]